MDDAIARTDSMLKSVEAAGNPASRRARRLEEISELRSPTPVRSSRRRAGT
jgi:hypothetical protein